MVPGGVIHALTLVGFLFYVTFVVVFSLYMVYKVVPKYGTKNPMVYISICSLVGSISVMSIKVRHSLVPPCRLTVNQGFGVALKLTFAGNNQLTHMSTYVFAIVVIGCILVQMVCVYTCLDVSQD